MKTSVKSWFIVVIVLALVQFACSFGAGSSPIVQPPAAATEAPSSGGGAPSGGNANAGQIAVSGALNKIFTAVRPSVGQFGADRIRLYLYEDTPADLSRTGDMLTFDFPTDIQPGTYDIPNSVGVDMSTINLWVTYGTTDGVIANFQSVSGTLTITAVGATYSGQFQFTAANPADASQTITVTGSFADLPINQ